MYFHFHFYLSVWLQLVTNVMSKYVLSYHVHYIATKHNVSMIYEVIDLISGEAILAIVEYYTLLSNRSCWYSLHDKQKVGDSNLSSQAIFSLFQQG